MKHYRTAPPSGYGKSLRPSTAVFHDRQEAEAHARETRSYVAEGREYDSEDKTKVIWYVPK